MRITDEDIDRAVVCSNTPTSSAVPAPDVLAQMRAAARAERRAWLVRRLARVLGVGGICAGWISLGVLIVEAVRR